jgi:hypothetical protein
LNGNFCDDEATVTALSSVSVDVEFGFEAGVNLPQLGQMVMAG